MVGMAGLAATGIYQFTMQTGGCFPLHGDVGMALLATVGRDAAPGGVALGTILFKFGVGLKVAFGQSGGTRNGR
jgi:hypothetical protein